jgi:hypothetical protein
MGRRWLCSVVGFFFSSLVRLVLALLVVSVCFVGIAVVAVCACLYFDCFSLPLNEKCAETRLLKKIVNIITRTTACHRRLIWSSIRYVRI